MNKEVDTFKKELLRWYKKEGRDLPWRHTRDPYKILVSEIMLQQTQVDRVIEKYHSFLHRFPTVQKLARAKSSSVIKEWAGLGYNRRALFLQKTAQAVCKEYGGVFPVDLEKLKALPGIGDYTARAVLSFAFEEKVPMMDTNHRKFYSRVLFDGKEQKDADLLAAAENLLKGMTKKQIYNWNQALMDIMSAVSRKEKSEFVERFDKKFPLIESKKKKKKAVPFKQTDRYVRGKIVDVLRKEHSLSIRKAVALFADMEEERIIKIIDKLAKDTLIKKEKKSIILP